MDPALQEQLSGPSEEEIEVIVRAKDMKRLHDKFRVITEFGDIATGRVKRRDIIGLWKEVECLKAGRYFFVDPPVKTGEDDQFLAEEPVEESIALPEIKATVHRSVFIGVLDWGFDITHPVFIRPDGSTKFHLIWDQGAPYDGQNKYGYGRIIQQTEIDEALRSSKPFQQLGLHPDPRHIFRNGTHGTHVAGIASRIAPQAKLIAVNLATGKIPARGNLGDSTRIVEALDFVNLASNQKPIAINMSLGSMAGSHTGENLVEKVIDYILQSRQDLAIVQSAGNYYRSQTHTRGRLTTHGPAKLEWVVAEADRTPNELEIWLQPEDEVKIVLEAPDGEGSFALDMSTMPSPKESKSLSATSISQPILLNSEKVGAMYLRKNDSTTGLTHADIFLYPKAPAGHWLVKINGLDIYNGEYHAWIERDSGHQSYFTSEIADPMHTTGTIAHSRYGIAVGAYDHQHPDKVMGPFSSAGSVLGKSRRIKPELVAPGVRISSAKSAAAGADRSAGEYVRKSGTSMAAPHVSGSVALMLGIAKKPLNIHEIRGLLFRSTDPYPEQQEHPDRYGHGILNTEKLITMTKLYHQEATNKLTPEVDTNSSEAQEEIIATENTPVVNEQVPPSEKAPSLAELVIAELVRNMDEEEQAGEQITTESSILGNIVSSGASALASTLFNTLLSPGNKLEIPLEKGDILVRVNEQGKVEQSLIASPELVEIANENSPASAVISPGNYAQVLETDQAGQVVQKLRQLTNSQGFSVLKQLLLRPKTTEQEEPSGIESVDISGQSWHTRGTRWNTYIYVVGTDVSGGSNYNIMKDRLIQVITERNPYLILTFDFHSATRSGGDIELRYYYRNGSTSGNGRFSVAHSLNQVFRFITQNHSVLSIKHLHFLTHFSDDRLYYSSHRTGFTITDVRSSISNRSHFRSAFANNPIVKLHGCQLDHDQRRTIADYCRDYSTNGTSLLNSARARVERSFAFKLAELLGHEVWAGPIGTYSSYHCRYLPSADQGRRFCIERNRFQRTLRFYESTYSQFFARGRGEAIYDFTYHLKYKPSMTARVTATPRCVSSIPAQGAEYRETVSTVSQEVAAHYPDPITEDRPPAGTFSRSAEFRYSKTEGVYIARGENPHKRMYLVTTGAKGLDSHPSKFVFEIHNSNDHLNMVKTFFLVRFTPTTPQLTEPAQNAIHLYKKEYDKVYSRIKGKEIVDESYETFSINFPVDKLKQARYMVPGSHRAVLELQFYWKENTNRYFSRFQKAFYVVNPVEIVMGRDLNPNELSDPYPFGNRFVRTLETNSTDRDIKIRITITEGVVNTNSRQLSASIRTSTSTTNTTQVGVNSNVQYGQSSEGGIEIGISKLVSAGLKSSQSFGGSVGTSISRTWSRTQLEELTKAYSTTQSLTRSFTHSFTREYIISPPSGKNTRNTLYIEAVFKPVLVTIVDYSEINELGFASSRKVYRNQVAWVFDAYRVFNVEE